MRANVGVMRRKSQKRIYIKHIMSRDDFSELNYKIRKLQKELSKLMKKKSEIRQVGGN